MATIHRNIAKRGLFPTQSNELPSSNSIRSLSSALKDLPPHQMPPEDADLMWQTLKAQMRNLPPNSGFDIAEAVPTP